MGAVYRQGSKGQGMHGRLKDRSAMYSSNRAVPTQGSRRRSSVDGFTMRADVRPHRRQNQQQLRPRRTDSLKDYEHELVKRIHSLRQLQQSEHKVRQLQDVRPIWHLYARRLFYGLGIVAFLLASAASIQTLFINKEVTEQVQVLGTQRAVDSTVDEQGIEEGTAEDPAETAVSQQAFSAYNVAPERPRYIRIPDAGVNARVKESGVNAKNQVDAPWNIHDVTWFNEGVLPGSSAGSSLLVGHVSGWTGPGVFKDIDRLAPGAAIEIERGDGQVVLYAVTRTERAHVDDIDMSKILGTEVAGEHDIKLMTCAGSYNQDTDQFEERFIVYARAI